MIAMFIQLVVASFSVGHDSEHIRKVKFCQGNAQKKHCSMFMLDLTLMSWASCHLPLPVKAASLYS